MAPVNVGWWRTEAFREEGAVGGGRGLACQFMASRVAAQLRLLRFGMERGGRVLARRERSEHALGIEEFGHRQPPPVAGPGVELGEAFVDPAIFTGEDILDLLFRQAGKDALEIDRKSTRLNSSH